MIINLKKSLAGVLAAALTFSSVPFWGAKTISNAPAFSVTAEESKHLEITNCIIFDTDSKKFYKGEKAGSRTSNNVSLYTEEYEGIGETDDPIYYDSSTKEIVFNNADIVTDNAEFLYIFSYNTNSESANSRSDVKIRLKGTNKITCTALENAKGMLETGTWRELYYFMNAKSIEIDGDEDSSLEIINTADGDVTISSDLDIHADVTLNFNSEATIKIRNNSGVLNLHKGSKLTMILPGLSAANCITSESGHFLTGGTCYTSKDGFAQNAFISGKTGYIERADDRKPMVLAEPLNEPVFEKWQFECTKDDGEDLWIYLYCPESISSPEFTIKQITSYSDKRTIEHKNLDVQKIEPTDGSISNYKVKYSVPFKEYGDDFEIYVNGDKIASTSAGKGYNATYFGYYLVVFAAMNYFNYNTECPWATYQDVWDESYINKITPDVGFKNRTDDIEKIMGEIKNATDSQHYIGSTLLLDHKITVCHYFTDDVKFDLTGEDKDKIKVEDVTIDGKTFKVLKLCDIVPMDYDKVTEVTMKYEDGTECYLRFSVLEYIYWVLKNYEDYEPKLLQLCNYLYIHYNLFKKNYSF